MQLELDAVNERRQIGADAVTRSGRRHRRLHVHPPPVRVRRIDALRLRFLPVLNRHRFAAVAERDGQCAALNSGDQ